MNDIHTITKQKVNTVSLNNIKVQQGHTRNMGNRERTHVRIRALTSYHTAES